MSKKAVNKTVQWLSEEVFPEKNICNSFVYYEKFQFENLVAAIGDYVLVSNADSAEPDSESGCDAARIISLYEDRSNNNNPFRAKVQWYSRPSDLPTSCFNNEVDFLGKEVLEDHRPFDTDVSIETFFKKCNISLTYTKDTDIPLNKNYHYLCRYRLIPVNRRKAQIEPVLEEERKAIELLKTPAKSTPRTPKTPSSLVKRLGRISISEQKNWSVSKNDGTKLLLKRAILTDKKETPKSTPKSTPKKTETPKSSKNLTKSNIEEILSMELIENSDDELPTLIIRQRMPTTPKRKSSIYKNSDETPKKVLLFDEDEKSAIKTTRSGRVTRNPVTYLEEPLSPVKRTPRKSIIKLPDDIDSSFKTPRKSLRKVLEDSEDEFMPMPKTPKTPRTPRTPKTPRATPGRTPRRNVTKKILTSQLTPSLRNRAHSLDNIEDYLKENKSLPGREQQMDEILSFVKTKLLDGTSGCMYISGVPGTGKTATVMAALRQLRDADLPPFTLVEVNGMRIAEPRQAYVQIYKQLTGKTVVWEQACSLLEKRFTNPGPRRTPTVLLVDELDALCNRRQDVLYSIMEWAAQRSAQLAVLAVANTMDLPERALAARVASRLGLTRLTFPPYTHAQLQKIVLARLAAPDLTADALQLVARKVAAVSGDARRALALCSRAIELGGGAAGLAEVTRALAEAAAGAAASAIHGCSPAERLMLRAVAAEVERTGSEETTLSRALLTAGALVALDGRPYRSAPAVRAPSASQARALCARLAALRLILMEPKPGEPRLLLNVSADDVHYATRQITVV